ncbi:MAG: hypothetical protein DRM99_04870 [Thermoplasmata archaeon]|nr:MAG: hypothetical protein DRM99_04870 [Thermoplasmata archaeon]
MGISFSGTVNTVKEYITETITIMDSFTMSCTAEMSQSIKLNITAEEGIDIKTLESKQLGNINLSCMQDVTVTEALQQQLDAHVEDFVSSQAEAGIIPSKEVSLTKNLVEITNTLTQTISQVYQANLEVAMSQSQEYNIESKSGGVSIKYLDLEQVFTNISEIVQSDTSVTTSEQDLVTFLDNNAQSKALQKTGPLAMLFVLIAGTVILVGGGIYLSKKAKKGKEEKEGKEILL